MIKFFSSLFLISALLSSGCGWLPDHRLDYRKAPALEPMQLPAGVTMVGEQPLYTVPGVEQRLAYRKGDEFEVPTPPQMEILARTADSVLEPETVTANHQAVLARDGSGYPMIMMKSSYAWAWEHIDQALEQTNMKVSDRNREAGVYYLSVPKRYGVDKKIVRLKLSQTANGIQVTVLDDKGSALLEVAPSLAILQSLADHL